MIHRLAVQFNIFFEVIHFHVLANTEDSDKAAHIILENAYIECLNIDSSMHYRHEMHCVFVLVLDFITLI